MISTKLRVINRWRHFLQPQHLSGVHTHVANSSSVTAVKKDESPTQNAKTNLRDGPGLEQFIANLGNAIKISPRTLKNISHPYVNVKDIDGHGRKVFFEVYGCQMNVSDVEVTWSILRSVGYLKADTLKDADVILVMTCAIREGAETKIWNKLAHLNSYKKKREKIKNSIPVKIGILGCMAERLKKEMFERNEGIDLVMGPDSYRDLPRLLAITQTGDKAVNVLLSQEETYADIMPVTIAQNRVSAFVSIMRGCDNMCSYCIVPFTRGRERSRPISSILKEIKSLSNQGIKEITLLGQNVNSYCDLSSASHSTSTLSTSGQTNLSKAFTTIYKPKVGGLRFADLLDKVSNVDPEMRIRFTSPHPKDFPDEVLTLIKERTNVCRQIHLPAQCGSSRVLKLMRRGYDREAYLTLVDHIRSIIPDVALSSDFIAGFCTETSEEFEETLTLIEAVKYNLCYVFPYSLREKTPAHRDLEDSVPGEEKKRRLIAMSEVCRKHALALNTAQIGQRQVVLVQGVSKRSINDLAGRNDYNTKVIFPRCDIDSVEGVGTFHSVSPGDYVEVFITAASSLVLQGIPVAHTTLRRGISPDV